MMAGGKPVVTNQTLWKQVLADFLGKEVQDGYTLTYVWMANQLGHFTLGLMFTLLPVWLLRWLFDGCRTSTCGGWVAAVVFVVGVVKEANDYRQARTATTGHSFDFDGAD